MFSLNDIKEEIRRSPVTVIATVISATVAFIGLLLAWQQYSGSNNSVISTSQNPGQAYPINLFNILLLVSYIIAANTCGILMLRFISRKNGLTAFFLSVPVFSLLNFSVILFISMAPPQNLTSNLFESARDLVLFISSAFAVAFFGLPVLKDLFSPSVSEEKENSSKDTVAKKNSEGDGMAILVLAILLFMGWRSFVSSGQDKLVETFLPPIAHPAPEVKENNEPNKAN